MKKLIFLLICILFFASAHKKKDNAIIIHENISTEKIRDILFNSGYDINKSDSNYLSTEAKQIGSFSLKLLLIQCNNRFL